MKNKQYYDTIYIQSMFLYLGATPILSNILITLANVTLTVIFEELIKEIFSYVMTLKEWVIMFSDFLVILLGTAEGLS